MDYKKRIKDILEELGLTQEKAEKILGYSKGSLRTTLYISPPNALKKILSSLENYKQKERLKAQISEKYKHLQLIGVDIDSALDRFEKEIEKLNTSEIIKKIEDATGLSKPIIAKEIGMSKAALYGNNPNPSTKKALELFFLRSLYEKIANP